MLFDLLNGKKEFPFLKKHTDIFKFPGKDVSCGAKLFAGKRIFGGSAILVDRGADGSHCVLRRVPHCVPRKG